MWSEEVYQGASEPSERKLLSTACSLNKLLKKINHT